MTTDSILPCDGRCRGTDVRVKFEFRMYYHTQMKVVWDTMTEYI